MQNIDRKDTMIFAILLSCVCQRWSKGTNPHLRRDRSETEGPFGDKSIPLESATKEKRLFQTRRRSL